MKWLKGLLGVARQSTTSETTQCPPDSGQGAATTRSASEGIFWDATGAPADGSVFFEALRPCLPTVFSRVLRDGRDPVVVFANLEQMRWRGLLRLMLDKPSLVYLSPEQLTGLKIQHETSGGVLFYRAPTIDGQSVRLGVYVAEREQVVYALCGIRDVPMPLVNMVKATPTDGMFTVAYFGFSQFGVRHVSRDATVCETPFPF